MASRGVLGKESLRLELLRVREVLGVSVQRVGDDEGLGAFGDAVAPCREAGRTP